MDDKINQLYNELLGQINNLIIDKTELINIDISKPPYQLKDFGEKNFVLTNFILIENIFKYLQDNNKIINIKTNFGHNNWIVYNYGDFPQFNYRFIILQGFINNFLTIKNEFINNEEDILNNLTCRYKIGILLEDYSDLENKQCYIKFFS